MEDQPKKFSYGEAILMLLLTGLADVIEAFVSAIGVVPIITPISVGLSWLINTIIMLGVLFWFIMKGERGTWYLAGSFLEYVPFLNILPFRTATAALGIYLANHPSIAAVASGKINNKKIKQEKNSPPGSKNKINKEEKSEDSIGGKKIKQAKKLPGDSDNVIDLKSNQEKFSIKPDSTNFKQAA